MRYLAFLRNAFLRGLAYRTSLYVSLCNTLIILLVQYYLWHSVFEARSHVAGMTLSAMLTYVLMARAVGSFLQVSVDAEIGNRVRTGRITSDLARPVDLQVSQFFESLGSSLVGLVFASIPTYITLVAFGFVAAPPSGGALLYFLTSLMLGYGLLYAISYLFGLLSFWTKTGWGLSDVKDALLLFFSGAFVPLDLYPGWLRSVAVALPFQGVTYVPVKLYTGGISLDDVHRHLLIQLAWLIVLLVAGRLLWSSASRRLVVHGG